MSFWFGLCLGLIVGGWFMAHSMKLSLRKAMEKWEDEIKEKGVQEYLQNTRKEK